jgi:hypothetical protein
MPHVSEPVRDLLNLVASPDALLQIATELQIGQAEPRFGAVPAPAGDAAERRWLVRDGFAGAAAAAPAEVAAALVRGIRALRERGLPATFIYAFDEMWAVGELVRDRIAAITGRSYMLVEDAWAWEIPPGEGGWPPHRGIGHVRLDREAPEILDVWVALSDASAERACMHAVPLDDDPGYPDTLERVDAPLAAGRALPMRAGDALFWNANVLHWGGRCAPRAAGPRVSGSFTLCRSDAAGAFPELVGLPALARLPFERRMDLVARMILLYGLHAPPDVSGVVREWAAITHGLSTRFSRA